MKWLKIVSGMFLLAFCSLVGASSPAFAVSDISVTYDSSNSLSDWDNVFPNCTGHCLDDYHYLIVSASNNNSLWDFNGLRFRYDGSSVLNQTSFSTPLSTLIFELPYDGHNYNLLEFYYPNTYDISVTYTLTESLSPGSPTGSITLTENGTYDVTQYSEAIVDVPPTIEPGDYHDDLVSIKHAIIICASVVLVIYFFYCIYRIIIKAGKR